MSADFRPCGDAEPTTPGVTCQLGVGHPGPHWARHNDGSDLWVELVESSVPRSDLDKRIKAELDAIDQHINGCASCSTCVAHYPATAIREVLDLHGDYEGEGICDACTGEGAVLYPCPTVVLIAETLGIEP